MGCGCKKKVNTGSMFENGPLDSSNPADWGPCIWFSLHCLTEKIGKSGNAIIDADQGITMKFLIQNLQNILPCQVCQGHARAYVESHSLDFLNILKGEALQTNLRDWLFTFHNAVRIRTQSTLDFTTTDQVKSHYEKCTLDKEFTNNLSRYVTFAVQQGWVKLDNWKRWVVQFNRLKLLI
jgi:hypothetical protein